MIDILDKIFEVSLYTFGILWVIVFWAVLFWLVGNIVLKFISGVKKGFKGVHNNDNSNN